MSLEIRRLSHTLGAEISGVDFRKPLDDPTHLEIHDAFLKHHVLLFRGTALTPEQHVAFSRRFGKLELNDVSPLDRHPDCPEVEFVSNKKGSPRGPKYTYAGEFWHSDLSFTSTPALASLLHAVEIPTVGGDTMFANLYRAYETLSDGMKKLIEGLHGVHIGGRQDKEMFNYSPERAAETKRRYPPIAQPLVRVHPETGRKLLFIAKRIKHLAGMTPEESEPLLKFLYEHAARPQFVYRHKWQQDDLLMWDNRCTNHIAVNDYDKTQTRHMEKTTVSGTPSGHVYEGPLHVVGL